MISGYKSFQVEIKKTTFTSEEGNVFPLTAVLTFEVSGRKRTLEESLGYVEEETIYQWIDEGKQVNLDYCFIGRFSLENYRISRKMDKKQEVTINGFSAKNSFLDSSLPFDFSHTIIKGESFDLTSAWFHRGAVNFDSAVFECDMVSFHDVIFSDYRFDFKNVIVKKADVIFKNTVFGSGQKDFQYTEFGDGELTFANAEFGDGDVSFINVDFGNGNTSYKVTRFGEGKVDFHFAKFHSGAISFERTEFGSGRVDFRTVEFGTGKVNFNRAQFGNGDVSFEESEKVSGKFSFKRVNFGVGDISFEEVIFENIDVSFERTNFGIGNISFYESIFKTMSFRFCHLDAYVDLRLQKCQSIDLSNTIVRDIIDLNPYEFEMQVDMIRFDGMRLIGRIYINWKRNHVKKLIACQEDSDYRRKAEQYRILKENFSLTGQYEDEDKSYVEFKRFEARANLQDSLKKGKINALWSYPFHWFKVALFDKAGLYATSPFRVLVTMLTIFVIFSLIFVALIATGSADILASVDDPLSIVARSFYHSAITFLTIGYGDHFPSGSIRWLSALEGFAGLFLMSYFTVAFVRKILR